MRHNEGYHRPARTWRPTDRQRRVLDALAEGKSNAEVAQRLGITVDGAKWHVGELLAQTGCADRQALARWWQERRERRAPAWLLPGFAALRPALAVLALAAATLGVAALLVPGRDAEPKSAALPSYKPVVVPSATPWPEEAVGALVKQDPPPSSCEPPERQDLRIVGADELRAQGLIDFGRVVYVGHCPLYVANRADRTVAWLAGGGYVKADFARGRGGGPCCRYGMFYHGGVEYSLVLHAPNLIDRSYVGLLGCCRDIVRVEPVLDGGAYVMLDLRKWVDESPGPISIGPLHRALLSSDGHLFMSPQPLPGAIVANRLTGEAIDVSALQEIGRLDGSAAREPRIDCDTTCSVRLDGMRSVWPASAALPPGPIFKAPVAGVLRCVPVPRGYPVTSKEAYELDAGSFRLRVAPMGVGMDSKPWIGGCPERSVVAGDEVPAWIFTELEALAPDGSPLSIVATRDGRLFVGQVDLKLGCPCEPRS